MDTQVSRLLGINETARELGVGITTIKTLVQSGELESIKIGRRRLIPKDAIEKLIADRRNSPSL